MGCKKHKKGISIWSRASVIILALALLASLFSSCSDDDGYDIVFENATGTDQRAGKKVGFLMQLTFGDENTNLLFAQGNYTSLKGDGGLEFTGKMTQTALGVSSSVEFFYTGGYYFHKLGDIQQKSIFPEEELEKGFLYSDAAMFDAALVSNIKRKDGTGGDDIYTFEITKGQAEKLLELVGEDIYSLAMLNKPQPDKTAVSACKCTYVISDGVLKSRSLEYIITVYDTPPYVPGQKAKEEDYRLDINVTLKMNYESYDVQEIELPSTEGYNG